MDYGDYIAQLDSLMADKWATTYGYGQPWRERQQEAIVAGAPVPTVEDWANQVDYIVGLAGPGHVGLGLDLMSGGNWLKDFDATSYPRLTEALLEEGHSAGVIRQILGENWLHLLDAAKVP